MRAPCEFELNTQSSDQQTHVNSEVWVSRASLRSTTSLAGRVAASWLSFVFHPLLVPLFFALLLPLLLPLLVSLPCEGCWYVYSVCCSCCCLLSLPMPEMFVMLVVSSCAVADAPEVEDDDTAFAGTPDEEDERSAVACAFAGAPEVGDDDTDFAGTPDEEDENSAVLVCVFAGAPDDVDDDSASALAGAPEVEDDDTAVACALMWRAKILL